MSTSEERVNELIKSNIERRDKRIVEKYFSNADQNVFALLPSLPQEVAGALFSRYSRTSLGARELFLKEFALATHYGADTHKAQEFYTRVLDGFGDDSVAELGGAHVALESISILATKFIQDQRIGGSPLEKSTRYVDFSEKDPDGSYRFYKDPTIGRSDVADIYDECCTMLFETYTFLYQPVYDALLEVQPASSLESEKAVHLALRSKTFDLIRGLLPASTLTNMGLYGNGRFFENLCVKLDCYGFDELNTLSRQMKTELDKVIPSFVRRAGSGHKHNRGHQMHAINESESLSLIQEWLMEKVPEDQRTPAHWKPAIDAPSVKLVDWSDSAEETVMAELLWGYHQGDMEPLRDIIAGVSTKELAGWYDIIGEARGNRRHKPGRGLEYATYQFDLIADFGVYRDLHRHRLLTQQRSALDCDLGYMIPDEFAQWPDLETMYHSAMSKARIAHEKIRKKVGIGLAQYVVPLAFNIRWSMFVSLRELLWIIELRTQPAGHENYRKICQEMYRMVVDKHPAFAGLFKFVDLNDYSLGRLGAETKQAETKQAEKEAADGSQRDSQT